MSEDAEKLKELRRKSYDKLLSEWSTISTWAHFYDMIDKKMKQFQHCGCPEHTLDALMTQYAFVTTLKELPEEGDIKKIVEHMARMMVYEGEKLGTHYVDDEEARRLSMTGALAARLLGGNILQVLGGAHGGSVVVMGTNEGDNAGAEDTVAIPESKKHLH